jgi:hypothetical protein
MCDHFFEWVDETIQCEHGKVTVTATSRSFKSNVEVKSRQAEIALRWDVLVLTWCLGGRDDVVVLQTCERFRNLTFSFNDGKRCLRSFAILESLSQLPKMPGADSVMLLQWFPAVFQFGDDIVSARSAWVSVRT